MHRSVSWIGVAMSSALLGLACEGAPDAQPRHERARSDQSTSDRANARAATEQKTGGRAAAVKHGFVQNIEAMTEANQDFRRVLYTGRYTQLVLMALPPREHIGLEEHDVDQFFRVESGKGEVVIDGVRTPIGPGSGIVVPAGARHDVINQGETPLKLYTLYSPPHHREGVVHHTRVDAERDTEQFDGRTTE